LQKFPRALVADVAAVVDEVRLKRHASFAALQGHVESKHDRAQMLSCFPTTLRCWPEAIGWTGPDIALDIARWHYRDCIKSRALPAPPTCLP
jgi:hypothetical protein